MKKLYVAVIAVFLVLGLTGCMLSLTMTITPNPLQFFSGEDVVDAAVTLSATGAGPLNITRVTASIIEVGKEEVLLHYDSDEDEEFQQMQLPFVVQGMTQSLQISQYLGTKTVNNLIAEYGEKIGVTSYEMLKGKTFTLKIELFGSTPTVGETTLIFN